MGMIDVSRQRRSLLADATVLEHLPAELLAIIQDQSSTKLLDAVAEAALCPPLTERVFAHFEHVFPDICARWILNPGNEQQRIRIYSALARILPFAPYLSTFIEYASSTPEQPTNSPSLRLPPLRLNQDAMTQDGEIFFDSRNFGPLTSAALMQTLFKHESKAIHWKLESLIQEHIGKNEAILADFDVKSFLTLRQEIQAAHETDDNDSPWEPSNLVLTPTTISNLERLATMLPKQVGMYSNMMLIGLYSTDTKPGSFQWRPGVLTTAVREGRWVLVEDLDRAPTEVLSTRGERIQAASTFRLFATVRTSRGMNGRENLPSMALAASELEDVVVQTYPILRKFIPGILAPGALARGRNVMDRQMTLRDLLKCETTRDWMFMEALIFAIAEEMHLIGRAVLRKKKQSNRKLLEQIAVAVKLNEPVLLVGETGIGKTTVLIAVNLSQQSEEEFEDLFSATGISASKNQKYLEQVGKCFAKSQWSRMFNKITRNGDEQPTKRRKTHSKLQTLLDLRPRWDIFAFSFMEGNLVKAINLASPDTLESIADLLTGPDEKPSILLSETGEIEKIEAHPNFRIFGAMNPATDIGKRDLPVDKDLKDLLTIIKTYLGSKKRIVDGANEVPHFSLRTLTRVLSYVNTIAPHYGVRRALYEDSEKMLIPLITHHLFERHGNSQSLLSQTPKHPNDGKEYGNETPIERDDYIITPYVERNLLNLTSNKFLRFQEGILVQAMRQGHWIVLDELNLAPTDLLIPETQEINPPGLYGGRKVLSRAFHELEFILQQRSRNTSPPDCRRIVTVRLFEQKDSFATLRDLFRWALREAETREEIAAHGFMLLAERVLKIDPQDLYSATINSQALRNNEPVLLVGETGCGKTTVELHIVNAHQNTETGDLIAIVDAMDVDLKAVLQTLGLDISGSVEERLERYKTLHPSISNNIPEETRARINGSLVESMREGHFFLLDEISLADDSVLERLNSGIDNSFVKELSPALRNRFTEIWVPALSQSEDIYEIKLVEVVVKFAAWFEILVWVQFINQFQSSEPIISLVHGASTIFIDSIDPKSLGQQRQKCDVSSVYQTHPEFIPRASTVLRALQMQKPILLEGSPGACDLMDLFGTDAMQKGEGEVYISELDQNPHHQGGGRKGLPASFVNRFIVVYADISPPLSVEKSFGTQGSPWEFNLRDVLQRDREEVNSLFTLISGSSPRQHSLYHDINPMFGQPERLPNIDIQNVPCILSSPSGYAGKSLVVFPMNADIDTMDLVGGFEQADPLREDLQNSIMSASLPAIAKLLENPRFEWLDGVIVKALQMGQWLVLDNANMCNASHCGPGGEPRVVRPHPDFRIFLTMDPRYGELSRAMRNPLDPSYNRVAADDVALLPRFAEALPTNNAQHESLTVGVTELLSFLHSDNGAAGVSAVSRLYASLPIPEGLSPAQPLHPLNNFPVTQLSSTPDQARWLGACLEFYHELYHLQNTIEDQRRQAQVNKLTALNRLQRSLVSDRVAAVSKDATVKLASFLVSTINAIKEWLALGFESPGSCIDRVRILRGVVRYLERTVRLATEADFDEAKFQAHLSQGANFLQKQLDASEGVHEKEFVVLLLDRLGKDFTAGFKLSTGLSMELLWHVFRPTPLPTKEMLDRTIELEKLGSRFDALRWKAGASIPNLAKAMATLEKASGIFRGDVPNIDSLLQNLTTEIESLESQIGTDEIERKPFLLEEFEVLRQVSMLNPHASGNAELQVLSNIPTQAGMMLASSDNKATLLQSVENLVYQNQFSWDGKFVSSFWSKLQSIGTVNLGSLALLEAELPIAGRQLANLTADLVENPLTRLNNFLSKLILNVFGAHGQHLREAVIEAAQLASQDSTNNSRVFDDLTSSLEPDHFRQIAIEHFVPVLKALAALQHDTQRQAKLSAFAWIHFSIGTVKLYVPDRVFDPQSRPKMEREFLQEMHALLDERTESLRSFEKLFTGQNTNERIRLLEAEYTALGPLPEEVRPIYRPEQSELSRLHAEFSNVLKAVTGPTLASGLDILDEDPARATEELQLVKENVLRLLDRLSARFEAYQDMTRPTANLLRCLMIGLSLCDAASARSLAPASQQILEVTPFLGGRMWNQKDGDFSSRTFEFLNYMSVVVSVEGIENIGHHAREMVFKSFHSLFDEWTKRLEVDRKEQAAKGSLYRFRGSLEDEEEVDAEEFNELFPTFDEEEAANVPSAKKQDEVRDQSLRVAQIHKNLFLDRQEFGTSLKEASKSVGDRITSETIDHKNIDRNLTSKMLPGTVLYLNDKLDSLVSSTVDKSYNFYTSANVPEARRLVDLMHKIKARFRELQMVDEIGHMQPLTDVIQACDQVLELVHSEPLAKILPKVEYLHSHVKIYGVLILHNLLTDTIIRWRRLELSTWANLFDMEQNKCQDDAYSWWFVAYQVVIAVPLSLVDDPKGMEEYASSLISSLEMYFSTAIVGQYGARLALLRQLQSHLKFLTNDYPILDVVLHALSNFIQYYSRYEKIMDEAKMKDVLLMASWKDTNINALRESARKSHQKLFRIEAKQIIDQGLPDQDPATASVPAEVFSKLTQTMPGWIDSHKRLANVSKTVSVMRKISESSDMTSEVPQTVDEFTPAFLNDENKDQIKHLKTRKRKLFADTLRDLRQMGLKHNLGQDKLAEQESLPVVLSAIKPYYLHKILDLAPKDLTSAEIGRSRNFISSGGLSLSQLKQSIEHGALVHKTTVSDWARLLLWLVQILQYAIRLVEVHGKLGEMNHVAVLEQLKSWYGRLQQLPEGLSSEAAGQTEAKFIKLITEQPKLSFVLAQIAGWTVLGTFANAIATLCDKILVAIEGAKQVARDIPRKEDEPAWLTTHSDGFIERSLHEQHLSQAAMSLMAIASPIVNEYVDFSQQSLMQTLTTISTQGFCTPNEKSDETSNESGKVESGTGLGDGEDLSELAQEANKEENGEIEDEKDAVDMADEELEGDMGSDGDEEEEENEMDEEAGDVDDLDPTAEKAEKDQQGEKAKDEDAKKQDGEEQPDEEEIGDEEEDVKNQEEMSKQEQTAQENDTLALPEDMDDGLDDLSDIEEEKKETEDQEMAQAQLQDEAGEEAQAEEDEETPEEEKAGGRDEVDEEEDATDQNQPPQDTTTTDTDNAAPSDVKSSGQDQNADSMDQEDGEMGEGAADQDTSAGNQGSTSHDPFKKLGDALERWHRQQEDIKDAEPAEATEQDASQDPSADQGRKEFQHLQDDETATDTQAMGTADDEQKQDPTSRLMEEDKDEAEQDPDKMDTADPADALDANKQDTDKDEDDTRSGLSPSEQEAQMEEQDEDETDIQETSTQLSTTHISDEERPLRDFGESMQQWSEFQTKTHSLSLALTSQLRLILTPSHYKRDKIWMRRSIPTKRTYQILLCVDDSKSMGETSSAGQVEPFASDAGAKRTIETFRLARQQGTGNADLWQLALIMSDGLTPSSAHEGIRRMLREAMEERIMIKKDGGESKVVIERYLDTFPFHALAGLLRTWFAEVNA
ncbi:hypothetical protein DER45DRAFT_601956 [Fusarium avenaceum]|nr:hypothetical protein DER45DRAFT_601956 [Fusarium avenaceum]